MVRPVRINFAVVISVKLAVSVFVLVNSQSGFRCLHSTVTALLESTNNWAYNIDQGRVNAVVFLDLKKAFDTVNHGILLSKMNAFGLGGAVGNWFKSYLSNRSQKCYVNGHLSNNSTLLCDIPQGTILGPLLFLLYINDLPNWLEHSQARMYADDTNLTFASNNIDDINYHLNHDLANVNKWLIANRLTLNQSKTEFMLIGSRQRIATFRSVPCLEIDGVPIDKVLQAKSLGVYLDENLSSNIQINELTKKIASGTCIGSLKRVRSFVPVATLQLIFNSLVQPYFNWVWIKCRPGLADSRTGGLADSRTGGLADWRTGGLADWRTRGLADWRTRELENWRTGGHADAKIAK